MDKDEDIFKKTTQYLARRDNITIPLKDGWQMNPFSGYPYQPIQLDSRYGEPSGSSRQSGSRYTEVRGRDGLPAKYRRTAVVTDMATRAMERLAGSAAPFLLTCNIYEPHPPMTAASEYLDNYWDNRGSLLVQPSIYDIMANSPYYGAQQKDAGIGYDDAVKMSELTAVYYAMVVRDFEQQGTMCTPSLLIYPFVRCARRKKLTTTLVECLINWRSWV